MCESRYLSASYSIPRCCRNRSSDTPLVSGEAENTTINWSTIIAVKNTNGVAEPFLTVLVIFEHDDWRGLRTGSACCFQNDLADTFRDGEIEKTFQKWPECNATRSDQCYKQLLTTLSASAATRCRGQNTMKKTMVFSFRFSCDAPSDALQPPLVFADPRNLGTEVWIGRLPKGDPR